ncbi:NAD(P)-binding protein [Mollisia scopiformis]|uniref:NAD(P)-binding protein n=1 Tax=Mollisia scopiformis TaxID=149040 RepID=A0A132B2I5_MOLSC|nr:NAD(P)-binding protein [Mollisia scopiformis]KUJ06249.1 NAD(P)-binding protein [Mollisia scopiformis]
MTTEAKILGTRLQGKVAIVTGGGSGFGEAISKRFAEEGCKVIVADMDSVGGERVASATHPHSMHFIKTNVANEADWEQLMENTLAKFGRVDILVNNAGTSYKNKPTAEVTEDEFDKVFAVNVKSIFHSARHFIPNLINQGDGGSIINIASIGATRPRPGLVWYNASKAAVANATKGLAAEYGEKQIRVVGIGEAAFSTSFPETLSYPFPETTKMKSANAPSQLPRTPSAPSSAPQASSKPSSASPQQKKTSRNSCSMSR